MLAAAAASMSVAHHKKDYIVLLLATTVSISRAQRPSCRMYGNNGRMEEGISKLDNL